MRARARLDFQCEKTTRLKGKEKERLCVSRFEFIIATFGINGNLCVGLRLKLSESSVMYIYKNRCDAQKNQESLKIARGERWQKSFGEK